MDLRSVFAPACTLSLNKSFLQCVEIQPCLHFEKPHSGSKKISLQCGRDPICAGFKVEEICDSTLADVQESTGGQVSFNFGTTQSYNNPPCFRSSLGKYNRHQPACVEADSEVIDCPAVNSQGPQLTTTADGLLEMPLDFIGHHNVAQHLITGEVRNKSFARYMGSSSNAAGIVKVLPTNIAIEDVSTHLVTLCPDSVPLMNASTIRRSEASKKTSTQHKKPARDLYRSSVFHMYELIFCYPFMDSQRASYTLKSIPKERYLEFCGVVNQISVGLAGGGLALVLFVASQMLCFNATFDGIKAMSLLRGVGLLWLSSALQKFRSVVRRVAECGEKARLERKEYLALLKKEVHSVTFKVCAMAMLSLLRLV